MNYWSKYKDAGLVNTLLKEISAVQTEPVNFMEVCGGHTHAIQKYGIGNMLPENIRLISGPGCPVCVTEIEYIDKALAYAGNKNHIIATYGDLIRVPGTEQSLEYARSVHQNIRIVSSPLDVLEIAESNPSKKVIFLAIGFETTAPGTALLIKKAHEKKLDNLYVLSAHKIMPPAMKSLLDGQVNIHGFLAPGHVTAITGADMYRPLINEYHIPLVIAGFEPVDILQSIHMLLRQIKHRKPAVETQYKRVVSESGNPKALELMNEVFERKAATWRGLGILNDSGLALKKKYEHYDIEKEIPVKTNPVEPKGCICGNILKGVNKPAECKLFGARCTPSNPVGACMVSPEGACQAYFIYSEHE